MIKMQVRQIWQASCPFCGKVVNLRYKQEETFCYCDEKAGYSIKFNDDD